MSGQAITLLGLLFVGHFLGDFTPLATRRMQEAKVGAGPPVLIVAHAGVHTVLVFVIVWLVTRSTQAALTGVAIQLPTHSVIDYVKMRLGLASEALREPSHGAYWSLFGLDQLAHTLVLLATAAMVL